MSASIVVQTQLLGNCGRPRVSGATTGPRILPSSFLEAVCALPRNQRVRSPPNCGAARQGSVLRTRSRADNSGAFSRQPAVRVPSVAALRTDKRYTFSLSRVRSNPATPASRKEISSSHRSTIRRCSFKGATGMRGGRSARASDSSRCRYFLSSSRPERHELLKFEGKPQRNEVRLLGGDSKSIHFARHHQMRSGITNQSGNAAS